jgi:hypothetical protein
LGLSSSQRQQVADFLHQSVPVALLLLQLYIIENRNVTLYSPHEKSTGQCRRFPHPLWPAWQPMFHLAQGKSVD